ncbi:MAG: hypothetical protein MZU84_01765 [Sphingobacterium sp.]|nr:hypothetical protein [Sphingobacterium sp.]
MSSWGWPRGRRAAPRRRRRPGRSPADTAIPLIDLAADASRQTVVDREPGQYLGHPTTVLLEDGRTMIAVYPKGHGRGPIVMKRSADGGLTWSERLPVPENWATSLETPTDPPRRRPGRDQAPHRLVRPLPGAPGRLGGRRRRPGRRSPRPGTGAGSWSCRPSSSSAPSAAAATWPCSTTTAASSPKRPVRTKPRRLHPLQDALRGRRA